MAIMCCSSFNTLTFFLIIFSSGVLPNVSLFLASHIRRIYFQLMFSLLAPHVLAVIFVMFSCWRYGLMIAPRSIDSLPLTKKRLHPPSYNIWVNGSCWIAGVVGKNDIDDELGSIQFSSSVVIAFLISAGVIICISCEWRCKANIANSYNS